MLEIFSSFKELLNEPKITEFQSPIGTNKTFKRTTNFNQDYKVSIPYRYKQNAPSIRWGSSQKRVSIPYRYKQNIHKNMDSHMDISVSIPYRYKQNSPELSLKRFASFLFQSPIGTNKTMRSEPMQKPQSIVSIPYRYKQN